MKRLMIIPAAGRGSRLGSTLPKLLVPVNGRPMIDLIFQCYAGVVDRFVVVVAPGVADLFERRGRRVTIELAVQQEPTGMLDAILLPAADVIRHQADEIWVTWCDQVAVRRATVARLAGALAAADPPAFAFPTIRVEAPYIHFDRDPTGRIIGVRQRREGLAMPPVGEADIGLFGMRRATYSDSLPEYARECEPGAGTKERNFLPFIPWLAARARVETVLAEDPIEAVGINTQAELSKVALALATEGEGR